MKPKKLKRRLLGTGHPYFFKVEGGEWRVEMKPTAKLRFKLVIGQRPPTAICFGGEASQYSYKLEQLWEEEWEGIRDIGEEIKSEWRDIEIEND